MVRRAARRACAFGLKGRRKAGSREGRTSEEQKQKGYCKATDRNVNETDDLIPSRKFEAVMNGVVVEATFAKSERAARWRE
jgi:hypothetical protein